VSGYAKVVADSLSEYGQRLTTFEVRFHRFVLAEFNTHRMFSRNSASSRAIPVTRQIENIMRAPAYPLKWPGEQKGMQGGEDVTDERAAQDEWHEAAMEAVWHAQNLVGQKVHKSVVNRLLEPFMWHTVVVTATGWENFFDQRCSPLAQPEIKHAAEQMRVAYAASKPLNVYEGEWHLPYADDDETCQAVENDIGFEDIDDFWRTHAEISAARCARVSYKPFDSDTADPEADLSLYTRLTAADPAHWSPLEHVATPWKKNRQKRALTFGDRYTVPTDHLPRVGNLVGWRSLRTTVETQRKVTTYR